MFEKKRLSLDRSPNPSSTTQLNKDKPKSPSPKFKVTQEKKCFLRLKQVQDQEKSSDLFKLAVTHLLQRSAMNCSPNQWKYVFMLE
ncbi:unnamed protein product [Cuscuta campestris]|uniref:Uncharacterized protein n=1 Tax=Cuscuta campestris TaxID=132261 RepID=A0A484LJD8_9ASTE|nr:unnamed protein product [Cuscuta campestris]